MKSKFLGLLASLVFLSSTQAHSSTLYVFDTPVSGTIAPAGTVELSVNESIATFTVALPSDYTFTKFALNVVSGGTVDAGAAYTVVANAHANFNQGALNYGPFNTVLNARNGGNFGSSLTFKISNYTGIFNDIVGGKSDLVCGLVCAQWRIERGDGV